MVGELFGTGLDLVSADLLEQLAGLFCIEVAFHAEMSNHLYLVLRTRPDVAPSGMRHFVVRAAS